MQGPGAPWPAGHPETNYSVIQRRQPTHPASLHPLLLHLCAAALLLPQEMLFDLRELHLLFLLTGSVQTYRSQLMQRVEYSVVIAGTDHEFPSAGSRRSPIPPLPLLPIEHLNLIHGHVFCFCSGKTMKWHIHAYNGIVRGRETKRHWCFVRREAGEVAGHGVLAC